MTVINKAKAATSKELGLSDLVALKQILTGKEVSLKDQDEHDERIKAVDEAIKTIVENLMFI